MDKKSIEIIRESIKIMKERISRLEGVRDALNTLGLTKAAEHITSFLNSFKAQTTCILDELDYAESQLKEK